MFPNTCIEEGLVALLISDETNLAKHTKNNPIKQPMRALHLLMKNNVFRLGKMYSEQKDITSIGAPPATYWAT